MRNSVILAVSERAIVQVIWFPHTNLQGQLKLLSAWKPGFLMTISERNTRQGRWRLLKHFTLLESLFKQRIGPNSL